MAKKAEKTEENKANQEEAKKSKKTYKVSDLIKDERPNYRMIGFLRFAGKAMRKGASEQDRKAISREISGITIGLEKARVDSDQFKELTEQAKSSYQDVQDVRKTDQVIKFWEMAKNSFYETRNAKIELPDSLF